MGEEEQNEKLDALSTRLDDNEELTDEIKTNFIELRSKVEKLDDDKSIKIVLTELSFPVGLKRFIINCFPRTISSSLSLFFGEEKKPAKLIEKNLGIKISYIAPKIITNEGLLQTQATIIRTGIEYLNFADSATWLTRPVLMYYGVMQILSGIIGCFFSFERVIPPPSSENEGKTPSFEHHGILWRKGDGWKVRLCNGFFEKLVACVNLDLFPNIFTFNNVKKNMKLNLRELSKNIEAPDASESDRFLIQYLCLYLFNSRARYDPANWNQFLRGHDEMYPIMIETYRDILTNMIIFIKKLSKAILSFYK